MKRQHTTLLLTALLASCQTPGGSDNVKGGAVPLTPANPSQAKRYHVPSSAGVEQIVSLSLRHHPALVAARQKIIRIQAKVPQARTLPDPKARIGAGSLAETAAGRADAMVGLEQQIPFPGKLRAQGLAAQKEADAASAELDSLKLRLAERVRLTYWSYYLAYQHHSILSQNKSILLEIQNLVNTKVEANQATQSELLRITTEIGKADQELISARQQINSSKASLNALLNRPAGAPLPAPRRSSVPTHGSVSSLIARAEASHPEIRSGNAKLAAFRHRLKRAKLEAYPDFTIGAQHTWISNSGLSPVANGDDQTMITLGITLPLWQKPRRAKVREAEAGIAEMAATVSNSRAGLRQRIEDAWFRANAAREMITLFDQKLLPDARQSHELALQAYTAGKQSLTDVFDTWRALLKLQLQQETNRASLGKAAASLKSAAAIR